MAPTAIRQVEVKRVPVELERLEDRDHAGVQGRRSVEFLDIIEPLTDPRSHGGDPADAFHLVIPSIPGFGLSGPTSEPGWSAGRVAGAFAELTSRLGYDRYGAQGGDEGAIISPDLGRAAPAALISPAALSIVTSLSADGAERNRALGSVATLVMVRSRDSRAHVEMAQR